VFSMIVMETEVHTDTQVEKWYVAGVYEDLINNKGPILRITSDMFFNICMWN
jgi:hypothetical protein